MYILYVQCYYCEEVIIMSKVIRENLRLDILTSELLAALTQIEIEGEKRNKSELIRRAIYELAKKELEEKNFNEVLQKSVEMMAGSFE